MKIFIFAGAIAGLLGSAAQAQDHSAEAVASAILNAMVARDVAPIAAHSNEQNAEFFAAILAGEEDEAELFEGTRGEAGTGWDGMILPARYRTGDNGAEAVIPFAIEADTGPAPLNSGLAGRYISLVLELDGPDGTSWGVEDINFIDRGDYGAMSEVR